MDGHSRSFDKIQASDIWAIVTPFFPASSSTLRIHSTK